MKTTIILVRHAEHDFLPEGLAGRRADVALNAAGFAQAERLAAQLGERDVHRVASSPQLRAIQTAQAIAERLRRRLQVVDEFDELDFGDWTGCTFQQLQRRPRWRHWNVRRSRGRPPRGESMLQLQERMLRGLRRLAKLYAGQTTVVVTHAEPIRAVILHCAGMSLDAFAQVLVEPASATTFQLDRSGRVVAWENRLPATKAAA